VGFSKLAEAIFASSLRVHIIIILIFVLQVPTDAEVRLRGS
jgi:hypothetical protein